MKYFYINAALLLIFTISYVNSEDQNLHELVDNNSNKTEKLQDEIIDRKSRQLNDFNYDNNFSPISYGTFESSDSDHVTSFDNLKPAGRIGRRRQSNRNRNRRNRERKKRLRKKRLRKKRLRKKRLRKRRLRRLRKRRQHQRRRKFAYQNKRHRQRNGNKTNNRQINYLGRQYDLNENDLKPNNNVATTKDTHHVSLRYSNRLNNGRRRNRLRRKFKRKRGKSGRRKFTNMVNKRRYQLNQMMDRDIKRADRVRIRRNRLKKERRNRAWKQRKDARRQAYRRQRQRDKYHSRLLN